MASRGAIVGAAQMDELASALASLNDEIYDLAMSLLEDISGDVVKDVRSRVPYRTGRAQSSYKVSGAGISYGGPQAPYVPWLEFGGKVGRKDSVKRPYRSKGRYLYPAIADNLSDVEAKIDDLIAQITGGFLIVEGS